VNFFKSKITDSKIINSFKNDVELQMWSPANIKNGIFKGYISYLCVLIYNDYEYIEP